MGTLGEHILRSIYAIPEPDEPALAAALAVARLAHPSEKRRKPLGGRQVDYITHPVLSYKLLRSHGVTDEITLMAALLHDALESVSDNADKGPYVNDVERLDHDLQLALRHHKVRGAASLAHKVVRLIYSELSIHEHTKEREKRINGYDKKKFQLDAAKTFSEEARLIKMADHAATLICDLMVAPDDTPERRKKLVNRILNVADVCADLRDKDSPNADITGRLHGLVQWLGEETIKIIETGRDSQGGSLEDFRQIIMQKLKPGLQTFPVSATGIRVEDVRHHGKAQSEGPAKSPG